MDPALQELLIGHRIGIERLSSMTAKKLDALLSQVQAEIQERLLTGVGPINERGNGLSQSARRRLTETLNDIRALQAETHLALNTLLQTDLSDIARYEAEWAARFYGAEYGLRTSLSKPSPEMLRSIVMTEPLSDKTLKAWLRKLSDDQVSMVTHQIRLGMVQGEGINDIANRLTGTLAAGWKDGVFSKIRTSARALTRTAVNLISNKAHAMVLDENPELFKRYQWVSVIDSRTSRICMSRSGNVYATGLGPIPPAHVNCRSTIIGLADDQTDADLMSYRDWLAKQPREDVIDILGANRAKLFLDGRLPIEKFVSRAGEELTLQELYKRERAAWDRAGLPPPSFPRRGGK